MSISDKCALGLYDDFRDGMASLLAARDQRDRGLICRAMLGAAVGISREFCPERFDELVRAALLDVRVPRRPTRAEKARAAVAAFAREVWRALPRACAIVIASALLLAVVKS